MREVMEYELKTKKKHLSKLQDYFRTDIRDIDSPKYEDNAINALLEMKKVKTEIEQLEYYLQLKLDFKEEENGMKKIKATITDGNSTWSEEYNIEDSIDAEKYMINMLDNFNSSLRHGEKKRILVSVEHIGEGIQEHKWEKTNGATLRGNKGYYDKYKCKICGITGKRYGIGGSIQRDSIYKAKCYENCTSTLKHLNGNS